MCVFVKYISNSVSSWSNVDIRIYSLEASAYNPTEQLDNLRKVIPGEPEIDYPIFRSPPDTSFTCTERAHGKFLSISANQVFLCAKFKSVKKHTHTLYK